MTYLLHLSKMNANEVPFSAHILDAGVPSVHSISDYLVPEEKSVAARV